MGILRFKGRRLMQGACGLLLMSLSACIPFPVEDPADGNVNASPSPDLRIEGEPNDTFNQALDVVLDDSGAGHLQGTIADTYDIDVFRLGEMFAGDRIIVDVATPRSNLDASVALFDAGGRMVYENDDRNLELGQYDPFINHVIRHDSLTYYLAIIAAPLAAPPNRGSYEILVQVTFGGEVPATQGQLVVLNFDGGSVTISDEVYTVDVFDTGAISSNYEGMTASVIEQIVDTVLDNYRGLNLDLRVVPGDEVPQDRPYSSILFGNRNPAAFGLSQQIDLYNLDPCDDAIVFTGMFTPFRFGRVLTADELGIAIGNVAAHELGHLLGLNHVANIADIMDTTGNASTFLLDQEFMLSPLHDTIFPIGSQDGLLLLIQTLGTIAEEQAQLSAR